MRRHRIKAEGCAAYHINSRIYRDQYAIGADEDKRDLLAIIRKTADFTGVEVMTFTLMDNHFHLLVQIPAWHEIGDDELVKRMRAFYGDKETDKRVKSWEYMQSAGFDATHPDGKAAMMKRMFNLTAFVKTFKEYYTRSHNKRHCTTGQVWGGSRFKSALVSQDFNTAATTACYVDLNAVRAGLVQHPSEYKWCGLGAAINGDGPSLDGLRFIVSWRDGRETETVSDKEAVRIYTDFLDGTRKRAKQTQNGDRPLNEEETSLITKAQNKASKKGTVPCLITTRLPKTHDSSNQKPIRRVCRQENVSEMWTRRMLNFVDGFVLGPLVFVLTIREQFMAPPRYRPNVIGEIYAGIKTRNERAGIVK